MVERLNSFGEGKSYGEKFVGAGIFVNYVDKYLKNLAKIFHKIITRNDERKNDNLFEEFKEFLEKLNYEIKGEALYPQKLVTSWIQPYKVYKKKDKLVAFDRFKKGRFNILALIPANPSEIEDGSGLVFLRIEGYEDKTISKEDEWKLRELVLEEWRELGNDPEVKSYLQNVKETFEDIKAITGNRYDYPFNKIAFYLLPVQFDRFFNAVIISRASLFFRKEETEKNLWNEIKEALKEEGFYEELEYYYLKNKKGKTIDNIRELLEKALDDEHLKLMREEWKVFLKKVCQGYTGRIKGVFLKKEEKPEKSISLSYGNYLIPQSEINIYIYYEEGTESFLECLKNAFKNIRYIREINVKFAGKDRSIYDIFGGKDFFEILRGVNGKKSELPNEESQKVLFALFNFAGWLANIHSKAMAYAKKGMFAGNFLCLNTDLQKEGEYEFWEYVRFIYDYFGLPVQTITKRTLEIIKKGGDGLEAVKKNLMISLYKDTKILRFEFEGFELLPESPDSSTPSKFSIYAFFERPSPKFFYTKGQIDTQGSRHYLYEVYKIDVEEKKAQVEMVEKFIIICNGFGDDGQNMRNFLQEKLQENQTKFCFITAVKDSFLNSLYEEFANYSGFTERTLSVRYMELKTAYISNPEKERDCFVIYSDDFKRILSILGIKVEEGRAVIAIKPPPSSDPLYEDFYHPSLQIFFTEKVGWLRDEVYSREKNLFFFTMITLSMYESEAAQTPFSKLNLRSTRRGVDLLLKREELNYRFNLWSTIFELLQFIKHVPGFEKQEKS